MNNNKNEQAAIFLLGTAIGTSIGLILATVFKPRPLSFSHVGLKAEAYKLPALSSAENFSNRIQNATTHWINQLKAITNDLVASGQMQHDEADKQINEVLLKVRQ